MNLEWLGHAGFRITNGVVIYIDLYDISEGPTADIVLITHPHFDHCSVKDIEKVRNEQTVVICPEHCAAPGDVKIVAPGDSLEIKDVQISVVPAYNVDKKFHPREAGFVGYVLTVEGRRIYHAGDTDLIPEMSDVECDVALLPVSGTYVMSPKEAADAASRIKPEVVIPMHYGAGVVGNVEDAETFARLCDVTVDIREKV